MANIFFRELLKKSFHKIPPGFLFLILLTCLYGVVILYSAGDNSLYPWAFKQIINFALFFPLMIYVSNVNLRFLYRYSYLIYFAVLVLLIMVELFGYKAMGAKRWLVIGGFRIQPSEPAKIAVVLFLARYFSDISFSQIKKIRYLIIPTIFVLLPSALVIKQPDLGTGMVIIFVSGIIFYVAGVSRWKFLLLIGIIMAASPIIWSKLHDYQKKRIEVFLDPDKDPYGSGYNIIQSKIAIGSGGFFGKGLGQGTQSHLNFLPEHQTDFIFACLAEDLGFFGVLILLFLYSGIIYNSMSISANAHNLYTKILSAGVASIFFSHVAINISMVSGLLPVVGIPLPLVSYGGTMLASILIGLGLIINVHKNKYTKL
jgi:rod shape determining protein RodA